MFCLPCIVLAEEIYQDREVPSITTVGVVAVVVTGVVLVVILIVVFILFLIIWKR